MNTCCSVGLMRAVTMPTTRPSRSSNGPPELPGFTAASIWMRPVWTISVSAGVVSGLDRSFDVPGKDRRLTGLFQIDAAVNPGNSGGALVNRDGQLIGIVTALINPTDDDVFIGIGLAVPIDVAGGAVGLPPY